MTKLNMQQFKEKVADTVLTSDHFYVVLKDDPLAQFTVHSFRVEDGYLLLTKFLTKGDIARLKAVQSIDVVYVDQTGEPQFTHQYLVDFENFESFGTWEWQDVASISAKYDIYDVIEV